MNKRGFTLVELMITITLGTIVIAGASITLVSMVRQSVNYQYSADQQAEMGFVAHRIIDSAREVQGLFRTPPGTTDLFIPVQTNGATKVERYYVQANGVNVWGNNVDSLMWVPDTNYPGDVREVCDSILQGTWLPNSTVTGFDKPGVNVFFEIQNELTQETNSRSVYVFAR